MDAGASYHSYGNKKLIEKRRISNEQRYFYGTLTGKGIQSRKKYFECHERSRHCLTPCKLEDKELVQAFRLIPKDKAADVFANMNNSMQSYLVEMFTKRAQAKF